MDTTRIPDHPFAWFELDHLGLTRHDLRAMVAADQVRRVLHGVYAPTHLDDSIDLRARCAALVLREHMVLADRTAAWLHGVDRYRPHHLTVVPELDVVGARRKHTSRRGGVFGGERDLEPGEITTVGGVRVTTPARTAADLACLFGRAEALAALDAFMRVAGVTREDLDKLMPRFRGRRGVVQLRELVPLATPLAESPGESWTRLAIHDAGFPAPRPQCPIIVNGREKYRLDLAYEQWKIVIEYDGREHHSSPEDRKSDEKRRTWLSRRGWIVIVVTKDDFRGHGDGGWLHELRTALDERMPARAKRRYARAERAVQGRRR